MNMSPHEIAVKRMFVVKLREYEACVVQVDGNEHGPRDIILIDCINQNIESIDKQSSITRDELLAVHSTFEYSALNVLYDCIIRRKGKYLFYEDLEKARFNMEILKVKIGCYDNHLEYDN